MWRKRPRGLTDVHYTVQTEAYRQGFQLRAAAECTLQSLETIRVKSELRPSRLYLINH
jgi:hypothetical protein